MASPLQPAHMPLCLSRHVPGPRQTDPGQNRRGPHRTPEVPPEGLAQSSGHATGHRLTHEPDVGRQIGGFFHLSEGLDLPLVHEEAASPEVSPRRPRRRNEVLDPCHRLVDDLFRRTLMHEAMAHVHVVMVVGVKTADVREGQSPHRHVGSDEPGERCLGLRKPGIRASEHPVELEGKPARSGPSNSGMGAPPTATTRSFPYGTSEPLQPIRVGPCVVVQERHDVALGELGGRIPGRTEATLVLVGQHHHRDRRARRSDAPSADGTVREGRRCDRRRQ